MFDLIIKGSKKRWTPPNFEKLVEYNISGKLEVDKAETKIATRFLNIKKYVHSYDSFF